jgi:hypothetical protein
MNEGPRNRVVELRPIGMLDSLRKPKFCFCEDVVISHVRSLRLCFVYYLDGT